MTSETESAESQVRRAVADSLKASPTNFDLQGAEDVIVSHVFRKQPRVTDGNRYEWFYAVMGMAVSIAQGWRDNHAADIKNPADTPVSIQTYIEKTYGVNFADYP